MYKIMVFVDKFLVTNFTNRIIIKLQENKIYEGCESMKKASIFFALFTFLLFAFAVMSTQAVNYSTPEGCASCHMDQGKRYVLVDTWKQSTHADTYKTNSGNTYCAKCKSPFEHTAGATFPTRQIVSEEAWQGVTCYTCHSPRKVENGVSHRYRLGNYIPGSGDPVTATVAELDNMYNWVNQSNRNEVNAMCTTCHNSSARNHLDVPFDNKTGQKKMSGTGKFANVTCVTCHMPNQEWSANRNGSLVSSTFKGHSMKAGVASCLQCHENRRESWAQRNIEKGIPHGTKFMNR